MVQTIGAINMFKTFLKLQFHNMAVISRWPNLVLFVVQSDSMNIFLCKIVKKKKKVLPDRGSCLM